MTHITKPSPCPILDDQAEITALSTDLIRAYRKYRRDREACHDCPADKNCPVQSEIEAIINQAATEVRDEWDKTHNQEGPK